MTVLASGDVTIGACVFACACTGLLCLCVGWCLGFRDRAADADAERKATK